MDEMRITRSRSSANSPDVSAKRKDGLAGLALTPPSASSKRRMTRTSLRAGASSIEPEGTSNVPADYEGSSFVGDGTVNTKLTRGAESKSGSKSGSSNHTHTKHVIAALTNASVRHFRNDTDMESTTDDLSIPPQDKDSDSNPLHPSPSQLNPASDALSENKTSIDTDTVELVKLSTSRAEDDQTVKEQTAEKTAADDEAIRLAAREKLRASNENLVRKLYRSLPANCQRAENVALDFISDEIHHPVISCFRELMNFNDLSAIFRSNGKKKLRSLEFGLIGLGILDSMAMTLHNPLYQETFDCLWNKKASDKIEKILQKLKPLLMHWGSSEKSSDQDQYDMMLKYLKRLSPRFQPINFSESFESTLSEIAESVTNIITYRQDLKLRTQSFFNCKEVVPKQQQSVAGPSTPTSSKVFITSSPLPTDSALASASTPTSETENIWKLSSLSSCSETDSPSPQKKSKVLFPSSSSNAATTGLDETVIPIIVNLTSKFDDEESPPSKKARIDVDDSAEKPKVNAFALMMNRSRQLAEMAKVKQQGKARHLELSKSKLKPIVT